MASANLFGTSSRSGPLRSGRMTSVNPARCAARTFCFTPADREHATLQRDLAGHADDRSDRFAAQQADEGRRHGDARPTGRPWARRPPARGGGTACR